MLMHREALELAKNASDVGDGVPFTTSCVNITPDGALVVTDGHHFLRMKAIVDEPSLFDGLAVQDTEELDGPVMIPADVAVSFNAAMKRRKVVKDAPVPHVVVAQADGQVTLRSSDGKTTRKFQLDAMDPNLVYPDVDKVVSGIHAPVRRVLLGVDLLAKVLRVLKSCKAESVAFGFPEDEHGPITINAFTKTGLIDGAIMPQRD